MIIEKLILSLAAIFIVFSISVIVVITGHRQQMLMIEKGINPQFRRASSGLKSGLVFTFLGIVLLAVFFGYGKIFPNLPWYTPGSIVLAVGLANLAYFLLRGRKETKHLGVFSVPDNLPNKALNK